MIKLFQYIKRLMREKREYRERMARVKALPEDYAFVYRKIEQYMWKYVAGPGMDIAFILADLYELFEAGAADGKHVLDITGLDVAAFCDELLLNAKTYPSNWRDQLNRDIMKKIAEENKI